MSTSTTTGTVLIAPQQYPNLDRESALAREFDLPLVVARDVEEFLAGLAEAAVVLLTPYARVGADELERMPLCRAVIRYGIGYDNVDVEAATRAGIPVSIVPGTASEEVASHAFAMGLALVRRLPHGDAAIRRGEWAGRVGFDTPKLSDLEVGVVGMGRIGQHVAQWWHSIGAAVRAYDPFTDFDSVTSAPLGEVLERSDVVSLHLPLSDSTRQLLSADRLKAMRRGAVVVNVSRGGLIDELALAECLASEHISGAGLDTFADEPLPADHALRLAPNLILTPHIAWRSTTSMDALQAGAVDRARRALAGDELLDTVN